MAEQEMAEHEGMSRRERQARNLARHLNESYPDTAVFLAHHAAGLTELVGAIFAAVTEEAVTLIVTTPEGQASVRLPFPTMPEAGDAREGLRALVEQTRAGLPAEPLVPPTSLELMLAGKPAPDGGTGRVGLHARLAGRHARRTDAEEHGPG